MPPNQNRFSQRKRALARLAQLAESYDHILVIHYSCESFHDRPDGASPRITSIAVRNLSSAVTKSFSIHQVAEKQGQLPAKEIKANYDSLELEMLKEFFGYLDNNRTSWWVHWNMRDMNYGFPALAHRLTVLGGSPSQIPEERLFDLGKSMKDLYGENYAGHPRLTVLRDLNGISDLDFMDGKQEAAAFENDEFYKLHMSTLRKTDVIANIFDLTLNRDLKTEASKRDEYGGYLRYLGALTSEHPIVVLAIVIFGVIAGIASIVSLFR
jgi:hypothetical protein